MKKIILLFVSLIFFLCHDAFSAETSLTILHTNSTNGLIESCPTCPNRLFGGLPRRASLIREYQQKEKNLLLLDSGDYFPVLAEKERAFLVTNVMNLLRYDAATLGDQEFLYGQKFLKEVTFRAKFPFLSATIVDEKTGKRLVKPYIIKEVSGIRIGIIGLTSPQAFLFFPKENIEGLKVLKPAEEAKKVIQDIKGKVDLIVVLSHSGYDEDEKLAQEVPGIDVIIGGHDQTLLPEPVKVGETIIAQAGKNAENLGELQLFLDKNKKITSFQGKAILLTPTIPDDEQVRKMVEDFKKALEKEAEKTTTPKRKTGLWGPVLQLSRSQWDIGPVAPGQHLKKEITIKDIGSQPLVISKIRSSCDCLKVSLDKKTLVPSESGTISLEFIAEPLPGKFAHTVYLQTNDQENKVAKIVVRGEVLPTPDLKKNEGKASSSEKTEAATQKTGQEIASGQLEVLLFYSPNCRTCHRVKTEILPGIIAKYGPRIQLRELDIRQPENYSRLIELEEKMQVKNNAPVEVFVGKSCLLGYKAIKEGLEATVERELAVSNGKAIKPAGQEVQNIRTGKVITRRFQNFSAAAVVTAGLLDGINPCAFAAIIFLVSVLATLKKKRTEILVIGIFFTLGVFCAYLLLGTGLLWGIKSVAGLQSFSEVIFYGIAVFAAVLGILSFRDAYLFWKTRKPSAVILQLPKNIKYRMHMLMKSRVSAGGVVISVFLAGFAVSFLESVCTGQVYLPTISFILKDPVLAKKAFSYLFVYNLAFILPLVVVFLLVFFGTGWDKLAKFSEKNLVAVKVLTGILFLGLASFLLFVH